MSGKAARRRLPTQNVGDFEKNVLESGKQLTLCVRGLAVRPPILTAIPFFS